MSTTALWTFGSGFSILVDVHMSPITDRPDQQTLEGLDSPGLDGRRYRANGTRPQSLPLRGIIGYQVWADCVDAVQTLEAQVGQDLTLNWQRSGTTPVLDGLLIAMTVTPSQSSLITAGQHYPYHIMVDGVFEVIR